MYSWQWEWEHYTRMEIYAHEDIKYLILGEDYNSYGYNYIGAKNGMNIIIIVKAFLMISLKHLIIMENLEIKYYEKRQIIRRNNIFKYVYRK